MAVVGAVAFIVSGRIFGIIELYVLAGTALALAGTAFAYVRVRTPRVRVERSMHPPRVYAGTFSRVDLDLANLGRRTTPVLQITDAFDGGRRSARFLAPPVGPRGRRQAAYRLPTDRRGIYDIGPLEVGVADPFGLASARTKGAGVAQLTVYPKVDRIRPLPQTLGNDPTAGADRPTPLLGAGDDFYALREYEVGDDTRRVHWKSTARTGELMIRQDEMPWQERATILLDVRRHVHSTQSLELAVSAAASIFEASSRGGAIVRLISTDGTDSGFSEGHAHAQAILEHLATIGSTRTDHLAAAASALRKAGNGGALAVITTDLASGTDVETIARLQTRYGLVTLVMLERSSWDATAPPSEGAASTFGIRMVRVTGETPFASAWDRAMLPTKARA
ncbi:MAG: DUF58 domain-containing protein [Acidimicrobiales bacterium]